MIGDSDKTVPSDEPGRIFGQGKFRVPVESLALQIALQEVIERVPTSRLSIEDARSAARAVRGTGCALRLVLARRSMRFSDRQSGRSVRANLGLGVPRTPRAPGTPRRGPVVRRGRRPGRRYPRPRLLTAAPLPEGHLRGLRPCPPARRQLHESARYLASSVS